MTRVAVVMPAFNEAQVIGDVIRGVRQRYPWVVVIDDGSSDTTGTEALAAGATVLRHWINRGQGAALQTGICYALRQGAEAIVTFDSDGQHRVEDVPALLAPLAAGTAEIALGSRFLGQQAIDMPAGRRALLWAARLFTRLTSGMKLTDTHNGLRAFSRAAAERLDLQLDRYAHASELLDQIRDSGLPHVEIPVTIRYTAYSLGKGQTSAGAWRILIDYLTYKISR